MTRSSLVLVLGLLMAAEAAGGGPAAVNIPTPHGWIGTLEDWSRALGIGFIILVLGLLVRSWRWLSSEGLTPTLKQALVVPLVVLPLAIVFFGYSYGIPQATTVGSCGSCHVMQPWVDDLRDPASENLAAVHYKNRYIQDRHCYTCHADYGLFGSVSAKVEGLRHVVLNATEGFPRPIELARPYPNLRCLACHGQSQKFLDSGSHAPEDLPDFIAGKSSCLDCHGPAHPPQPGAATP